VLLAGDDRFIGDLLVGDELVLDGFDLMLSPEAC
jgi:hypothetical protein